MSQEHSTPKVVNLHSMTHEDLAFEAREKYYRIKALGAAIIGLVHESEVDEIKKENLGPYVERLVEMISEDLDKINDFTEELAARNPGETERGAMAVL